MPELQNGADDVADIRATLAAEIAKASEAPDPADSSPAEPVEAPSDPAAAPAADQRARDEATGRFAKAADKQPKVDAQPTDKTPKPVETKPATEQPAAPAGEKVQPPSGWSPAAKAAWDNLPVEVRKAVASREQQVNQGFAKLQEYRPLDKYIEMAKAANTNLPDVLERYAAAEKMLQTDAVKGLLWLAQNYNVDPRKLVEGLPPQGTVPASQANAQPQQMQLPPEVIAKLQRVDELERIVFGDKQAATQSQVEAFFTDPNNRYAENVAEDMAGLIRSGQAKTLQEAYDKAIWANPEVRDILIREESDRRAAAAAEKAKSVAANAKRAGASIAGGPSPGQTLPGTAPPDDLRANLVEQFRTAGARV